MSFRHIEGIGLVHLNEIKPPRVVPGNERHRWDSKPGWGEKATCVKCGCVKHRRKPEYIETYKMPGQQEITERPPCSNEA